jgi:hypothetical protein
MQPQVLYSRSVSTTGRVRYDPVGYESGGTLKPGIWLVRDTGDGHAESWIAPICDVPTAIHAACLATFRDRLALEIAKIPNARYSNMDLAEVCLDALRRLSPPVAVAGKTTKYYVCAGCGRPIDRLPPLIVDMATGRCVSPGIFGPGTPVYAADAGAMPPNAQEVPAVGPCAGRGSLAVSKGGKRPECHHGAAKATPERASKDSILAEATRQIEAGCRSADTEVRKIGGRVGKPFDIRLETMP